MRHFLRGDVMLWLYTDMIGWPQQRCVYPGWITERVWRDLDGRHTFHADDNRTSDVIRQYFRHGGKLQPEVLKSIRCHRILDRNTSAEQFVAIAFVSSSW